MLQYTGLHPVHQTSHNLRSLPMFIFFYSKVFSHYSHPPGKCLPSLFNKNISKSLLLWSLAEQHPRVICTISCAPTIIAVISFIFVYKSVSSTLEVK